MTAGRRAIRLLSCRYVVGVLRWRRPINHRHTFPGHSCLMTALATAGNARVVHWRGRPKATGRKARG